jgi:hypothetical protein
MGRVNLTKIQKEDGTTVWTLRGANSEGVMQIRQQAGGRDTPTQLVSVEIPLNDVERDRPSTGSGSARGSRRARTEARREHAELVTVAPATSVSGRIAGRWRTAWTGQEASQRARRTPRPATPPAGHDRL